jgi:hypothetical protein
MIEVEGKIDNHPISILIDYGASHSYINSNIIEIFHLQRSKHKKYWLVLELLHTHLGFIFPKVFPCLLVIISHYPVSYILGENIPPGEYSLSVDTSV